MTDQTPETSQEAGIFAGADQDVVKKQIDTILDLDTILSSARMVERTTRFCIDGELQAEYDAALAELEALVDLDGNPVDEEDATLGEESKLAAAQAKVNGLRERMKPRTLAVRWRALPSDEWEAFDKSHKTSAGAYKDRTKFENELMAKCAVEPPISPADVETKLRKKLNQAQFVKLFNDAFFVNNMDGIDVPKLPSYLPAPKPQE
jgi:hypothetical protein